MSLRYGSWLLALGFCLGCDTCSSAIATLASHRGEVQRDFARAVERWSGASDGSHFEVGDGLRTRGGATALLELRGGAELRVQSDTTIRFRPAEETALTVDVEQGEANIKTGDDDLSLATEFGLAVLSAGSEVRVSGRGGGRRIQVAFGAAQVPRADGKLQTLAEGQFIDIGFGAAQIVADTPTEPEPEPQPEPATEGAPVDQVTAEITGQGVRQRHGDAAWEALPEGAATIESDTRLELPEGTRVELRRADEHVTLEGRGQHHVGSGTGPLVRSLDGRISVEAAAQDVVIEVPGGHIVARGGVDGGSLARLAVNGEVTRVEVERGQVAAQHAGEDFDLGAGDSLDLGAPEQAEEQPEDVAAHAGKEVVDDGVAFADLVVPAGQIASIYDPRPPTAVGFRLSEACPSGGQLRIGRKRAAGEAQVNLSLDRGTHRYRVYCREGDGYARRAAAAGRIRVLRSAGTQRLPKTAPKNHVELDGRRYTVLFSNRLPAIELSWPTAPSAASYSVEATLAGGKRLSAKSPRPRHVFEAGALPEGEHRVSMLAASGQRSRETTIVVRFDNAAPTASLRAPAPEGFDPASAVSVSGVVLPGSSISVDGKALSLDHQLRFDSQLPPQAGRRAIAIRIEHPRTGVRYYVRRAKNL